MATITFKEMLRQMESSNATFSVEWVKLDFSRKKGGDVKRLEMAQLKRNPVVRRKKAAKPKPPAEAEETFNLYDADSKLFHKVYKRLIVRFNDKNVIY